MTDAAVSANGDIVKNLFGALTRATAAANQLPNSDEFKYHTTFESFAGASNKTGAAVLKLLRATAGRYWPRDALEMHSKEDVVENFDDASDVLDRVLEQVDVLLDRHNGVDLSGGQIEVLPASQVERNLIERQKQTERMMSRDDKLRPQLQFSDWPIDNSHDMFKSKLFFKPNAKIPLEEVLRGSAGKSPKLEAQLQAHVANLGLTPGVRGSVEQHPYSFEIKSLEYGSKAFEARKEILYDTLDNTPVTWIDQHEQLVDLAEKLNTEAVVAIDLEAHSQRSFQGYCCLCQISTRTADYLIDTLMCRSSMHLLNLPFTNPAVVKVLHGSDSDVVWLQRDFGVYLVNMFDTGQAARVLELPKFGLAYLLKEFCGVDADKKYQRADWRQRPLPAEMYRYAREDTHYLLYCYDRLRNLLIEARQPGQPCPLRNVLTRSEQLCLKQYQKPILLPDSHLRLFERHSYSFNPTQMRVFAALFQWRDAVARELDESCHYVCPNHAMFSIAESQPQSVAELVGCCPPSVLLVRQRAHEVVKAVVEATRGASSIPNTPALASAKPIQKAVVSTKVAAVAPPERGEARKQWKAAHSVPTARLSTQQCKAASVPIAGSLSWQLHKSCNEPIDSKPNTVLQEISQMSLLQVAAQTMAHKIKAAEESSPKLKQQKLFESKASKIVAAAAAEATDGAPAESAAGVSEWLHQAREQQVKPEIINKSHKSVVEQYGEVAKGASLKSKKRTVSRKSAAGAKKREVEEDAQSAAPVSAKKRKTKAVDEMEMGIEKRPEHWGK